MDTEPETPLIIGGVKYQPLSRAAKQAQVPRQTLLNWIKNDKLFGGQVLQSCYLPQVGQFFLSEDSIQLVSHRFVKWPSRESPDPLQISPAADLTSYVSTTEAARTLGVSSRTAWLWASHGLGFANTMLDVIKCTTSDRLYIHKNSVAEMKKLIPRSGLSRGRPPESKPAL